MAGLQGMIGLGLSNVWQWLNPKVIAIGDFGDYVFFKLILNYLKHEIENLREGILQRMMELVGFVALIALTIWIMFQGYRMVTGQMRESAAALITNTAKAVVIVTVAMTFSLGGEDLTEFFTTKMESNIHEIVTGEAGDPSDAIDENLGWMQVAMTSLDVLDTVGDAGLSSEKDRNYLLIGIGSGGPAIVAGAMLLMYQVAMALFIGLGPLFILCLLFDFTKSLFQRWLFYGIGTMFSLAVLSAMTSIALSMVSAVAEAMWGASIAGNLILGDSSKVGGYNSQAMQQGGMGLILTTLILTVPPMAASFFQGTLGQFAAYGTMGAHLTKGGQPPGQGGFGAGGGYGGGYTPPPSQAPVTPAPASTPTQSGGFGAQGGGQASTPTYATTGGAPSSGTQDQVKQGSQLSARGNNPYEVPQVLQSSPQTYGPGASSTHTGGGSFAGGPTSGGGGGVTGGGNPTGTGSPSAQPSGPPNKPRTS